MSILGPAGFGAIGLAGSIAGSQQRAPAATDRMKADEAARKLIADDNRMANRDLDDSIETELSHGQVGDRDPDGRLPWQFPGGQPQEESEQEADETTQKPKLSDSVELGRNLDLNA